MSVMENASTAETAASAHERACNFLRQEILSGRYPAGKRLKTEEIAGSLGVSRMPVRDALQHLHSEGLVEIRPNRGAIVTSLGPADVLELFEIRAILEGLAARHACLAYTPDSFERLDELVRRMAAAGTDVELWLDLHEQFHEGIVADCGRPRLHQQVRNSRRALLPYIRMYIAVYEKFEMQDAEHDMLVSIARRRSPDLLEAAMREHILSTAKGVAAYLEKKSSSR